MALLVDNCPRCQAEKITFDVMAAIPTGTGANGWQKRFEVFVSCRRCRTSTVFLLQIDEYALRDAFNDPGSFQADTTLNRAFRNLGAMSLKDRARTAPPSDIPEEIRPIFEEASTCMAVRCWNAAATMFRLCLDLATRPLLPAEVEGQAGPNKRQRRDLGLRIPWLLANNLLPRELERLAGAVREDGNDGAHVGNISEEDAEDLMDFTVLLLERLFTEPARIAAAAARRAERRRDPDPD